MSGGFLFNAVVSLSSGSFTAGLLVRFMGSERFLVNKKYFRVVSIKRNCNKSSLLSARRLLMTPNYAFCFCYERSCDGHKNHFSNGSTSVRWSSLTHSLSLLFLLLLFSSIKWLDELILENSRWLLLPPSLPSWAWCRSLNLCCNIISKAFIQTMERKVMQNVAKRKRKLKSRDNSEIINHLFLCRSQCNCCIRELHAKALAKR